MTEPDDTPTMTTAEAWAIVCSDDQPDEVVGEAQVRLCLTASLFERQRVRELVRAMVAGPERPSRRALAHTLARVNVHPKRRAEVRRGLLALAFDLDASPGTRGEALDGLGMLAPWSGDEVMARRVVPLLDDPEPEVQFWTAYLLGQLGWRGALPALRQLASTSTDTLPGWWSVAGEAQDVIDLLEGRQPPDRTAGAPNDGLG